MKQIKFLFLLFCLAVINMRSAAQSASGYLFTMTNAPFVYLTGATSVPSIETYDGVSPVIPIGFTFNFAGSNYTDIVASTEGWISFNTGVSTSNSQPNSTLSALPDITPAIFPLWDNLGGVDYTNGPVFVRTASYKLAGTAPNRVFSFEWRNWEPQSAYGIAAISFQVLLFESSNIIQFHYQNETISGPSNNASQAIGIAAGTNDYLALTDVYTLPIAASSYFTDNINMPPTDGQVYTFTPPQGSCAGTPAAGNIALATPYTVCASGTTISLIDTGYSNASGIGFQWQSSSNGGANWTNIAGANNYYFQQAVASSIQYRVKLTCAATSQAAYSAPIAVNVGAPQFYNTLPYFQDFENWQSFCGNMDVPGDGWKNTPTEGNASWRREDQGTLAFWNIIANGYWSNPDPFVAGSHRARFSSRNATVNVPGNLDLYVDCSQQSGNKGLYFNYRNNHERTGRYDQDSLRIFLSTNGGVNFTHLASFDTANWERIYLPLLSISPTTVIRFQGINNDPLVGIDGMNTTDLGLDSVYVALPCTGAPVAGSISGPASLCPGTGIVLTSTGASVAGDLTYQWEYSTDNGGSWSAVAGTNGFTLRISALYDTTLFRLKVTCNAASLSAFSNVLTVSVQTPDGNYAGVPFTESFEDWMDRCDSLDVPGTNGLSSWTNNPPHVYDYNGTWPNGSWRRDDQLTAGQSFGSLWPDYTPASVDGLHSARFPESTDSYGSLDALVDCSGPGSSRELRFFLNMPVVTTGVGYATDSFKIFLSTNGGISFDRIGSFRGTNGWVYKKINFASNSSKTIVRFSVVAPHSSSNSIGLDLVKILSACNGQVVAGTVDSLSPCAGKDFYLQLSGGTEAGKIKYQWQESANGNVWLSIPADTIPVVQHSINNDTWYRCILKCQASGLSDTTPARLIQIAPFYYCYCDASGSLSQFSGGNIGNLTIMDSTTMTTLLNNGLANPPQFEPAQTPYSNYQYLPPATLYRDTSYYLKMTEVVSNFYNGYVQGMAVVYIDFNRDSIYDPLSERAFVADFNVNPDQVDSGYFHVPLNAQIGPTGMRCLLNYAATSGFNLIPDPCSYNIFWGEVEDYIVNIGYAPCSGPLNPGICFISDTLVASGAVVQVFDATHDYGNMLQVSQLSWLWQSSPDGLVWTDIAGSEMFDTVSETVTQKTWFRLKMICQSSQDTTYSNVVYSNVETNGLATPADNISVTVYPNPAESRFTIRYEGIPQKKMQIRLLDLYAQELLREEYSDINTGFSDRINTHDYPRGIYMLRIDLDETYMLKKVILK